MKKFLFLKLLALVACLSSALSATAHDFAVDGICYNIVSSTDQTVEVTRHSRFGSEYYTGYGNVIPSTVTYVGKTWTVVAIGDSAFYRSSTTAGAMLDLTMPNTITRIGKAAFYQQTDLTSLTLSSNLKTIDDYAFDRCSGLTSMTIPNGVTTIGSDAFAYCSGLSSVTIPNSVTVIKSWAFYHCNGLTSITIPNSVTSLGVSVFNGCSNLKSVTIGSGLTTIPNSAFNYCSSLKTVSIPNSVTLIDNWAFGNCTALESISIGSNVTSINYAAFNGCASLSEVVIPDKVTTIESTAFQNCTSLTKFTIGKSVTSIGGLALDFGGSVPYYSETALPARNIYCRSTVPPTIQSNTFGSIDGVSYLFNPYLRYTVYVHGPYSQSLYSAAPYWSNFSTIPSTSNIRPEQRYDFLVGGIYYLISGSNTAKVTNKNGGTLSNDNITSYTGHVTIPNTAYDDYTSKTYNVTAIGTHAFDETRLMNLNSTGEAPSLRGTQGDLKSVTVGNNVTTIEEYAFTNATGLACVSLGTGVTSIGSYAFNNCTALTSVISRRATPPTITSTTFDNSHYTSATLYVPSTAAVNNYKAATYWKNFTNITVFEAYVCWSTTNPAVLTFYCDGLRSSRTYSNAYGYSITYDLNTGSNAPAWNGVSSITLVVFDESFANARPTSTYQWFTGLPVQFISGLSNLNTENVTNMSQMFYNCAGLWDLDVSNFNTANVTDMSYMFGSCAGLTSLDLSNFNTAKVTDMSYMFYGCTNLLSLDVSSFNTSKVTNMSYMFYNCQNLTDLDVSSFNTSKVTNMSYMFGYCYKLTSLDLSNFNTAKVTNMEAMFGNCSKLTTIYAGSGWTTNAVTSSAAMFSNCTKLVGGKGTTYNSSYVDKTRAHIDGGPSNPGYFTDKNASQTGDVNGDGQVTIADVTALIDSLLSGVEVPLDAADVNGDGSVTIADVTALIDQLLGS